MKAYEQAPFLCSIGVSYHAYGDLKHGRQVGARWFKTDKLTKEQKEKILATCPDAFFHNSSPIYAPEIKKVVIYFPTDAQRKRNKNK